MLLVELPSIYALKPLEQGGPTARSGFLYQDHVAARFCIEMLRNADLEEVWCETLDDITLIRRENGTVVVEFVQVKAAELTQMWSVSLACEGKEQSLIAKSLAQHRCSERCKFRVVTRVGVSPDLKTLQFGLIAEERCLSNKKTRALHEDVGKRLDGVHSPAGWSPSNWLGHVYWDVAESEAAIVHFNLLELEFWLEDIGEGLFSDQREEVYNLILARVIKASSLKQDKHQQKKLKRAAFRAWVLAEIQRIRGHMPTKGGANLVQKMTQAQIPGTAINHALQLKVAYRRRMLDPKYQQEEDYKTAELELTAHLNQLVARLDSGIITDTGLAFHATCLDVVAEVQQQYSDVELSFLQGSMYSMTDRCRHRYLPAPVP